MKWTKEEREEENNPEFEWMKFQDAIDEDNGDFRFSEVLDKLRYSFSRVGNKDKAFEYSVNDILETEKDKRKMVEILNNNLDFLERYNVWSIR